MIGIQIIAVFFGLVMVYLSYLHFRRGEFKKIEFVLWQILWIGFLVVVIYPSSVNFLLDTFSITRAFDLVVIVGIVVVFGVTFRNYVIIRRLEKKIEDYTRKQSLSKFEGKK